MQNLPRAVAVIGGVVLISFGLGYVTAPAGPAPDGAGAGAAESTLREALMEPSHLMRAAGLAPRMASAGRGDLQEITAAHEAWYQTLGVDRVSGELLSELWARHDPAAGFEQIDGWERRLGQPLLPDVLRAWARRDPAAAREAAESVEGSAELKAELSLAVVLGSVDWRGGDPWDDFVAAQPFGSESTEGVLRALIRRDGVDAVLQRASGLPDDVSAEFRTRVLRFAARLAAMEDVERGARFAEQHGAEEGGAQLEAIVAGVWGRQDGARAAEWVLSRPEGDSRNVALNSMFTGWVRTSRLDALAWADQQPVEVAGAIRRTWAQELVTSDPRRALEMSLELEGRPQRRIQREAARQWLGREPETAAAWLTENGLAELAETGEAAGASAESAAGAGGGKDG